MAHPHSLVPGNCYFRVEFYDNNLLFPDISTLEYVGEGADEAGVRLWLFREPRSVDDSSDPSVSSDEDSLVGFSAEQLYQILDFAGLSAVISEVAVDHPLNSPGTVAAPPNGGRTRVLEFPVPDQRELLTQLCKRVLVEVYDMQEGDTLQFHFLDATSA